MAQKKLPKGENKNVKTIHRKKLRTLRDLSEAYELLYNQEMSGLIDSKAADGINTTLKGSVYLNVKVKMDLVKLLVQAKIKKISIPDKMLDGLLLPNLNLD